MKKKIMKVENLINVAVSSCLFLFLIFFMLKPESLTPCDCIASMQSYPLAKPISSLKEWELNAVKEQTNWTEEQIKSYQNCEDKFQNYNNANSLCTGKNQLGENK